MPDAAEGLKLTDDDWKAIRAAGGIRVADDPNRPWVVSIEAAWPGPQGHPRSVTIEIVQQAASAPERRYSATVFDQFGECVLARVAGSVSAALAGLGSGDFDRRVGRGVAH
jgi:hypothetical protein